MKRSLESLLDHLHDEPPRQPENWRGWRITPAAETISGLTYLIEEDEQPLGVKFATRDCFDRAGTEYACLSALRAADMKIAPEPVLLETARYSCPVIVRTWLCGRIVENIPQDDRSWEAILDHLLAVHSLTPRLLSKKIAASVPTAALTAHSAREGLTHLREHLVRELSSGGTPAKLASLVEQIERTEHPFWPHPQPTLCRGDPNRYNFLLQRDGGTGGARCLSFDWEYGGWGDPAFEVASLISAPTMVKMSLERKEWLIAEYAARSADETVATRIRAYHPMVLAWWAIRFARFLMQMPPEDEEHGPPNQAAYERYLSMAEDALQRIP